MNKEQILKLLSKLNFPKDEYYVLSGASMVIRGIRKQAKDLDLCISIKVNTKITKKGKIIFTNLVKKYYTEFSCFSILLNISFSL